VPYAIDLSIVIDAPPERVWRALCDPAAVVRWDSTVTGALDAPPDYPQAGQHVRWRCRNTTELLHDHPQHVEPNRRLHSLLDFGRQHLDETYTLEAASPESPSTSSRSLEREGRGEGGFDRHTTLHLHIELSVRAPFIAGPILLHLVDGPMTRRAFRASLTNLKRYCEAPAAG
jgi:uncharacterized protein YndB with AHSA1/START domain